MKFTYVLVGWEGSAHDGRLLRCAVGRAGCRLAVPLESSAMGVENHGVKTADASSHERKINKKKNKRAASSDLDLQTPEKTFDGDVDGLHAEDDLDEPTMGDKLASLNLLDVDKADVPELEMSAPSTKPPSADSVHLLLRQALNADDRVLLMDCLHTQDDKVIANTISRLNPSDVLKLLNSLISLVQSRGAVLVCALPWLKSLLLQHASVQIEYLGRTNDHWIKMISPISFAYLYLPAYIYTHTSDMDVLSWQLIESRVSTFQSSLKLSSSIDYLFAGIYDDAADETNTITPTIYEDKDESDEDEPDAASETDYESDEPPPLNNFSDLDGSDGMSE